jgi:hypothetical protein
VSVQRSSRAEFQSAFVAMSYFAGARGPALLEPLGDVAPRASRLAESLARESRHERALALADELAKIAGALKKRSLR